MALTFLVKGENIKRLYLMDHTLQDDSEGDEDAPKTLVAIIDPTDQTDQRIEKPAHESHVKWDLLPQIDQCLVEVCTNKEIPVYQTGFYTIALCASSKENLLSLLFQL